MQLFVRFYTFANLTNEMKFKQKFVSPIKNTRICFVFLVDLYVFKFPKGSRYEYLDFVGKNIVLKAEHT